jgi:hypothetical protein
MTSFILRIIALVSVTCNCIAIALVDGTTHYAIYMCLRSIGQMAIPITAFLVVEGFHHTTNRKFYFLRLFAFGIAAMMPYLYMSNVGLNTVFNAINNYYDHNIPSELSSYADALASMQASIGDYSYTYYSDLLSATGSAIIDPMVTLSFSLLMVILLDKVRAKYYGYKKFNFIALTTLIILATILVEIFLYMEECIYIPLFVCLFYFQRGNRQSIAIMSVIISILFYTSGSITYSSAIVVAVLIILSYNGKEGIQKYEIAAAEAENKQRAYRLSKNGKNTLAETGKNHKGLKKSAGSSRVNGPKIKASFLIWKYVMYAYYPVSIIVIYELSKVI